MKKSISIVILILLAVNMCCGCTTKKVTDSGVTLKWYIPNDKMADLNLVNDELNRITQEKLGVKINLQFIDLAAYQDRMNMNMASGDDYDIAWFGYMNTMVNAVSKGGLMPLDDLIKSTPKLAAELPDYVWEQAKIKGVLYAVPNLQILTHATALLINKELADKYNFDVNSLTKTTDIEPFLKIIKENEPGIYPFHPAYGVASFRSMNEENDNYGEYYTGVYKDESTGKYVVTDGQDFGKTYERAKQLNNWYKKGYIRRDIASVMDDTSDLKAGKYAVTVQTYKPGNESEFEANYGYKVYQKRVSPIRFGKLQARSTMLAIGKDSKHPEQAIKFVELLNTDKTVYNLLCFGVEGKHYNKVSDNRIELVNNSGYCPMASWKFGNQFNAYLLPGQPDDIWEETKKSNDTALRTQFDSFDFDITNIKNIITKLKAVTDEYICIRQGTEDPDNYWDDYKKKLYECGVQDYINEYQRQIDIFCGQ